VNKKMKNESIVNQSVSDDSWRKLREDLKLKQARARAIRKLEEDERDIINSSSQIRRKYSDD
jgi:hypothetical protein